MVGPCGLEPQTSTVSRWRSSQLSYGPSDCEYLSTPARCAITAGNSTTARHHRKIPARRFAIDCRSNVSRRQRRIRAARNHND
jgi:hypothetical protein